MCGILGTYGITLDDGRFARMLETLRHRGPDMSGVYAAGRVRLGHRRLSIIDLSEAGRQPMTSRDERYVIVYNGETYNFRELRKRLQPDGPALRSSTDTEVVLEGFARHGVQSVEMLNGMFAFGIYDRAEDRLYLARDRFGIKPLFYAELSGGIVFASEIKAILESGLISPRIDLDALEALLAFGYVPAPATLFQGIRSLLPGEILTVGGAGIEKRFYFRHEKTAPSVAGLSDAVELVTDALMQSVADQTISDVPLGAFLSGGIDSSLIALGMSRAGGTRVRTFSIGFDVAEYDETSYARTVAERLGVEHEILRLAPDSVEQVLPEIVNAYEGMTTDSSALPTYYLCRMTRKAVTVALSGDGGDELFMGYTNYPGEVFAGRFRRLPALLRKGLMEPAAALVAATMNSQRLHRIAKVIRDSNLDGAARFISKRAIFDEGERARMLRPEIGAKLRRSFTEKIERVYDAFPSDPLERLARLDVEHYLPNDMLVKVDRMSMAHSLEVRVPFLDNRVLEASQKITTACKLAGQSTKHVLRTIAARHFPPEVATRAKRGFGVPLHAWFRRGLAEWAGEKLTAKDARIREFVRDEYVRGILRNFRNRHERASQGIWMLLNLECLLERFFD